MNAPSSRRVRFLSSGPEIQRFQLGTPCSTRTRYDPWIYHEANPITSVATNFSGSSLGFVDTLRQASFTGGTLHGASLGLFVGATSIAASRAKALPRWISAGDRAGDAGDPVSGLASLLPDRITSSPMYAWSWDRQNRDSRAPDGSSTTLERCE